MLKLHDRNAAASLSFELDAGNNEPIPDDVTNVAIEKSGIHRMQPRMHAIEISRIGEPTENRTKLGLATSFTGPRW